MENTINHFKAWVDESINISNSAYISTESPKGEFGVFLCVSEKNKPYRCSIRSPGFFSLGALNAMSINHFIADLVTIIGTQDIVFGEIDR